MAVSSITVASPCCFTTRAPARQAAGNPRRSQAAGWRRQPLAVVAAASSAAPSRAAPPRYPDFFPPEVTEIEEPAAQQMLASMQRVPLSVEGLGSVATAYVGPASPNPDRPAFVLLHGFDSSNLEFRRFLPLLSAVGDVYAVDLAGWGFTDAGFAAAPDTPLGPPQKRAHLRAFITEVVGRPVTLLGTSLGGSVAIDYAVSYAEDVQRLVLVDAQGFIDGIGPMASMPRFLSVLGVKVLRSVPLRQMASQMAYYDKKRYATDDAMRVARLHTFLPGWTDANVAFMRSGGYAISARIKDVRCPTLVVWGRNDEILSPDTAEKFLDALPGAQLVWVEECGHCAHLEQPHALLRAVCDFCGLSAAAEPGVLAEAAAV